LNQRQPQTPRHGEINQLYPQITQITEITNTATVGIICRCCPSSAFCSA
jgi:hypothetical protein